MLFIVSMIRAKEALEGIFLFLVLSGVSRAGAILVWGLPMVAQDKSFVTAPGGGVFIL